MAEAVVSVLVEHSVSLVLERLGQEVKLVAGVKEEVENLADKFRTVRAVLEEAEKRQVEEVQVKVWLEKLKDVAYHMDDVLDEWITKFHLQGVHQLLFATNTKICSFIPSPCSCFNGVTLRRDIAMKIASLNERLEHIALEKEAFKFSSSSVVREIERAETTTFFDVPKVCGRDSDKDTIVTQLLCLEADQSTGEAERKPLTVSIVGTGGIGKTTLAQLCFKDDAVRDQFEKRMWVSCDPFDEIKIAKAIVEELEGDAPTLNRLNALLHRIQGLLKDKRFLLVLDDVWSEDERKWGPLQNSLMSGSSGSKILVTTRSERVARIMGSSYTHTLRELSEEDSWLLFAQIAFFGKSMQDRENLEEIGRKIVEKCKGSPLVVKSIGSLLRLKDHKQEWESILNSEVWESEVVERYICPALLLSYYDLPPTMKQCLLYCAIFPKGEIIEPPLLIQLWMAQGYLESRGNIEMETIGREYFMNLASRSFFQDLVEDRVDGSVTGCKMHDVVHDFVQFLTRDECIIREMDCNVEQHRRNSSSRHARHLALVNGGGKGVRPMINNKESLRTLLFRNSDPVATIEPDFLHLVMCLRALDFSGYTVMKRLPRKIKNLIHLRYLDLSFNEYLQELPDEICDLYNLQTLKIDGCTNLKKLPAGQMMGKLINLRYFECDGTSSLRALPKGVALLKSLRTLNRFIVSEEEGQCYCGIGDLRDMKELRSLCISSLGNVRRVREIAAAELSGKIHLKELVLRFSENSILNDQQMLEALQLPINLGGLSINGYGQPVAEKFFSNWMLHLPNLKKLKLVTWRHCGSLPPLGRLPSLETLSLRTMHTVRSVGSEFLGIEIGQDDAMSSSVNMISFPKLKYLTFAFMKDWEKWNDGGSISSGIKIMPRLLELKIVKCEKLMTLPEFLQSVPLQTLSIMYSPTLEGHCREGDGKCWSIISHIPTIDIVSRGNETIEELVVRAAWFFMEA